MKQVDNTRFGRLSTLLDLSTVAIRVFVCALGKEVGIVSCKGYTSVTTVPH